MHCKKYHNPYHICDEYIKWIAQNPEMQGRMIVKRVSKKELEEKYPPKKTDRNGND
jgi:hypothetical protein